MAELVKAVFLFVEVFSSYRQQKLAICIIFGKQYVVIDLGRFLLKEVGIEL